MNPNPYRGHAFVRLTSSIVVAVVQVRAPSTPPSTHLPLLPPAYDVAKASGVRSGRGARTLGASYRTTLVGTCVPAGAAREHLCRAVAFMRDREHAELPAAPQITCCEQVAFLFILETSSLCLFQCNVHVHHRPRTT